MGNTVTCNNYKQNVMLETRSYLLQRLQQSLAMLRQEVNYSVILKIQQVDWENTVTTSLKFDLGLMKWFQELQCSQNPDSQGIKHHVPKELTNMLQCHLSPVTGRRLHSQKCRHPIPFHLCPSSLEDVNLTLPYITKTTWEALWWWELW